MNKDDELGAAIVLTLGLIIALLIIIVIDGLERSKIKYKYFIGEKIETSEKCYVDNEKGCLCKVGDKYIEVDSYYEIDN